MNRTKVIRPPRTIFDLPALQAMAAAINALRNGRIVDGNGNVIGQLFCAEGNTVFQILAAAGDLREFKITAVSTADYFVAQIWDGSSLGGVDYTIAKHEEFRPSFTQETRYGANLQHAFLNDNQRTTSDGSNLINSWMCPPFDVGRIIFAAKCKGGTDVQDAQGNVVEWIDLTPREWLSPD